MKYFIPIFSISRGELLRRLRFYKVRVEPPIKPNDKDYSEKYNRLLSKYIRMVGLVGFPSKENIIGLLEGKPKELEVIFDNHKYRIKPIREIRRESTYLDINKAISALLQSKYTHLHRKGYILKTRRLDRITLLKCAATDIYHYSNEIFISIRVEIAVESPTLDEIIRRIGDLDRLKNIRVRSSLKYMRFTKMSGRIKRVITKDDPKYSEYWNKIEGYYKKEGEAKLKWFQNQPYGVPILIVTVKRKGRVHEELWLSTALVIQFHPENYKLFRELFSSEFDEVEKEIHKNEQEMKYELERFTVELMRYFESIGIHSRPLGISLEENIFKPFSALKLKAPKLKFAEGESYRPTDVFKYKVVDLKDREFDKIYIITTYSNEEIDYDDKNKIKELLSSIKQKLRSIGVDSWYEIGDYIPSRAINKLKQMLKESTRSKGIILQILAERDESLDSPYAELRRDAYDEDIPVQTILKVRFRSERFRKDRGYRNALINNLAIAIYGKVGGRPWALSDNVSNKFRRAIYIGYDISRRGGGEFVGTAVVYDSMGQFLFHYPYPLPTKGGRDIIPKDHMVAFIKGIIEKVLEKYGDIDAVIVHKDGEVRAEEIEGIREGVRKIGKQLHIIIADSRR